MRNFLLLAVTATTLSCSTFAKAEDLVFSLINESPSAITAFHVSPASTNSWEHNLLAGGILDVDYEIDVIIADGLTTCIYDIRADFRDGETFEDYGLDLCDTGSYTFE